MAETTIFAGIKPLLPGSRAHRIAVLAYEGVVLGDLAVPVEIFGRVRDEFGRACYELRICSTSPKVETEYLSLRIAARLSFAFRAETLIVPGIDSLERTVDPAILRVLRFAVKRGARVASICTGAFVLARAGVLDHRSATTHWFAAEQLRIRYPLTKVDPNVLYVDNGQILTSAGAAAGMDLCLHMIRRDFGASIAASAARHAVMPLERAGGQAQFIEYTLPNTNDSLKSLLAWMERNLERRLSLSSIARQARMSTRTLSRQFRLQVGTTPARWITRARVQRAQGLLEATQLSIEKIAVTVGFGSSSVLREHFSLVVGVSPTIYRRSFKTAKA